MFCKINVSSSNDSLNRSMCIIPHQRRFEFAFFSYPTTKALSGVLGRYESGHTCIAYVAKSKTKPQGDASHTL
jgi:hypothetical protein